jgi:hypothetical protein
VLKAHLLAEEVLYRFIESQAHRPEALGEARLGFAQLIALCRSFHTYSKEDWWGWAALKKLNSLRNLLAHNLEPKNLKDRIVDFSVFVAAAIGATTDSEIGQQYELLAKGGTHPFVLALVALTGPLALHWVSTLKSTGARFNKRLLFFHFTGRSTYQLCAASCDVGHQFKQGRIPQGFKVCFSL